MYIRVTIETNRYTQKETVDPGDYIPIKESQLNKNGINTRERCLSLDTPLIYAKYFIARFPDLAYQSCVLFTNTPIAATICFVRLQYVFFPIYDVFRYKDKF